MILNTILRFRNTCDKEIFDLREVYPKCEPGFGPQYKGNGYVHANAYTYSFRNCIKHIKDGTPPKPNENPYVRTIEAAAAFKECGSIYGGYRRCVAKKWAKQDNNIFKEFDENELENEIKNNGPVFADFEVPCVE